MKIVESENFVLESHEKAEVSREDGGHLVINSKVPFVDRTQLPPELVIELALLTNVAGKAMTEGLGKRGIRLGRINYQDNGNWRAELHVHLYGRAFDAKFQTFGEPLKAARKPEEKILQEPLNEEDCQAIRESALQFSQEPGYETLLLK